MHLKVGELARRTGVTVRTLHHYDSIGLLRPSLRSDAGYRLYSHDDVARLHGIQALRRMGVPLKEVARLLDGGSATLAALLARQVQALDQDIARSQALRERLQVMQRLLARGGRPAVDDWLATLSLMSTYEQYFSVPELQRIFERWSRGAHEWAPVVQALRVAMGRGIAPDALEIQPCLQQWLDLATRWMDGDLASLGRWSAMLREQPGLPLPDGIDAALLDYIDRAIAHRQAVAARHIGTGRQQQQAQLRAAWRALVLRGRQLMGDGVPPDAQDARVLAREWHALLERSFGDDVALRDRVIAAYEQEPLLHAGIPLTPALRRYLEQAHSA